MRLSLLAAALVLSATSPAFAHRLHVEPSVVGEQLRVEAFYADDTPAQDAKVTVHSGDAIVAEGRTDEKGVWTCAKPAAGTYTVRAESVGHVASETIVIAKPEDGPPTATVASNDSGSAGRKAKTRTPWRNLVLGIGLVGAACLAWLVSRKTGRPPAA